MTKPVHPKHDRKEVPTRESTDDDEEDEPVTDTVIERIYDELDPDQIHGIAVTAQSGSTYYCIVSESTSNGGGDVINLQTVVVDLAQETVKVHKSNGLWLPRSSDVMDAMTRVMARTTSDVARGDEDVPAVRKTAVDVDIDSLLGHELAPDEYEGTAEWGSEWGNGQGEPPQVYEFVDRLREADVETERFIRLRFGEKRPHERYENRPASDLLGNYGIETLADDPLIVIDVDDPDVAPIEEIPETYAVSSPHGDDRRAHHFLRLEDGAASEAVAEHFGSSAVKPGWGDIWLSGEYVVGPGSYLDGCDKDDCHECDKPEKGRYEVLDDQPIAEIESGDLIELLESSWIESEPVAPEPEPEVDVEESEDEQEDETVTVDCADCGRIIDHEESDLVDRDGEPAYVCGGGCDE